jgi:hypothetical protein
VRNLKLLVLGFAALGLGLIISDFDMFKALLTHPFDNDGGGLITIGGFAVPLVMGVLGMTRPPFMRWQGLASLAGFAAIAIKGKIWEALPKIMDYPIKGKIGLVAVLGGVIVSALATARPEETD